MDIKVRIIKWADDQYNEKGIVSLLEANKTFNVAIPVIQKILEQTGYYSTENGMKKKP